MTRDSVRRFGDTTRAVAYRNIRNFFARPVVSLIPMVMPLMFFATFAGGFSRLGDVGGFGREFDSNYTSFQFVFVWLQGSAFQGMFSGFGIARDYESGFARRLMLAAPNRNGILSGYLVATLFRSVIGAAIVFAVGKLAGSQFNGGIVDTVALVASGFALTLIASLWAAGVALRFRSVQAGPLMQMPIFVVIFLSPVFIPLALMRGWIKQPARVNPFTVFIEQGRNFITGADAKGVLLFVVALAAIFVMTLWSVRGLRAAQRAG
jgi:ABC-2 type transport system permease protein